MRFDVAVVGLGLIGSAAARHLAAAGAGVVGIGPSEPTDWAASAGPFASHYDSGRITRKLDARYEWAVLASRSIAQYPYLEEQSGIQFHHPVGLVFVRNDQAGISHQRAVIERLDLPVSVVDTEACQGAYPWFDLPSGWAALVEPGPAGFIDPRRLLAAQLRVAEQAGAPILRVAATTIERHGSTYRIRAGDAPPIEASQVIIATGPYLDRFLPEPLAATVVPEAVILGEVPGAEAVRLDRMPSLIYLLDHPDYNDVYLVPPTRYPDGRWYLKMGGSFARAEPLRTDADKRRWMGGAEADAQLSAMQEILTTLLPRVRFERFAMKPCLITDTAHGLPFVDRVDDGLVVAAGGNGHAAKSSDAIGALAAGLVTSGGWPDTDLAQDAFAFVSGTLSPGPGSRHGN